MQRPDQNGKGEEVTNGLAPFRRILVAIDESEAAHGAVEMVAEWVGHHGAKVWFVQLTEERRRRHRGLEPDAEPTAGRPLNRIVACGPTFGARNRQLAQGIAQAASAFGADVIVLGFDRSRMAGHLVAPSLRELITRATELPVLVAPAESDRKRRLRRLPELVRGEEQAHSARRYAHV